MRWGVCDRICFIEISVAKALGPQAPRGTRPEVDASRGCRIEGTSMPMIDERVKLAREGKFDKVVCRLASGWVVMGDVQFLEGYCLLLPDPVVPSLNDLKGDDRTQFLMDMARIGDAVLKVTGAARINYEILGNAEPELHAHVFPRYATESEERRTMPVWFYDWKSAAPFSAAVHGDLRTRLREELQTPLR